MGSTACTLNSSTDGGLGESPRPRRARAGIDLLDLTP